MKLTKFLGCSALIIVLGCEPKLESKNQSKQSDIQDGGSTITVTKGCNFNKLSESKTLRVYSPGSREENQIRSILTYAGLPLNFEIYAAEIDNAAALIVNDKRIIIYDKRFLNIVDQKSYSYWSSMSILAHEIGHHLSGHTLQTIGSNHNAELEADKFSGFVLQKMGASLSQAQQAISIIASDYNSSTHPGKARRLEAIRSGWEQANKLRHDAAIPPPPEDIINPMGGLDEFNTEHLIDAPSYDYIKAQSGNGFGITDMMDGIIIETTKNDYSILVTKSSVEDTLYLNKIISVEMYNPWDSYAPLGRAQYSWLDAIMVPGRRIRFAFWGEGTGDFKHFVYVKSLPGNLY
jgi:hypothetical protein